MAILPFSFRKSATPTANTPNERNLATSVADFSAFIRGIGGNSLPPNEAPVNDALRISSAGQSAIVMACGRKIAWVSAGAKYAVLDDKGNQSFDHPVAKLVANPRMHGGKGSLLSLVAYSLTTCAKAYVHAPKGIVRSKDKVPAKLEFLRPDRIEHVIDFATGVTTDYRYNRGYGAMETIPAEDVIEIKHPWIGDEPLGMSGDRAHSQMTPAWQSIDLHAMLGSMLRKITKNSGGMPGLISITPRDIPGGENKGKTVLTSAQRLAMKEFFESHRGDGENFGKPGIIEGDAKFIAITENLASMQVHEGRNHAAREICAVYGVPHQLIGIGDDAKYENLSVLTEHFLFFTIIPGYCEPIAQALSDHFGLTVVPNYDDVPAMIEYRQRKMAAYSQPGCDWISKDEKRKAIGLPEMPNGMGKFGYANDFPKPTLDAAKEPKPKIALVTAE
jgi:HK97 family phage portal protein